MPIHKEEAIAFTVESEMMSVGMEEMHLDQQPTYTEVREMIG
jgi:hypothetical protein